MKNQSFTQEERWLLTEKYRGEKTGGFFADCKRLQAGEPLGYVIGFVPFLDCKIWLDSHPLIPRPETEYWVEKAITKMSHAPETLVLAAESLGRMQKDPGSPVHTYPTRPSQSSGQSFQQALRKASPKCLDSELDSCLGERLASRTDEPRIKVLDLCAGSGAIGVVVATHVPGARVDFGEIDARHEPTILKNLAANGIVSHRARVIISDLFTRITDRYDFILSNPPYIDPALDRTEASVKHFEPHQALYGGHAGLKLIEAIIAAAPAHLTPRGQLWLEHEPEQTAAISKLGSTHGFATTTHPDQYDSLRYSILVLQ